VTATYGQAVEVPWASALADYRCFGCSPHNPHGLRLTFLTYPDGLESRFCLDRTFESYPGVVHGGVISTVCDETMGNLIVLREGRSAFTVGLRLRFLSPLAIGQQYRCVAKLRADGHFYHGSCEVLDDVGVLLVTATGTYQPVDMERAREHMHLTDQESESLRHSLSQSTQPNGA
jgi:acyl-coenzyme A thioesterase PaaI-like protein